MTKKYTKITTPFDICNYCMNYLTKDVNDVTNKLSEEDLEFIRLFHNIRNPYIQQNIISLLRNIG